MCLSVLRKDSQIIMAMVGPVRNTTNMPEKGVQLPHYNMHGVMEQ